MYIQRIELWEYSMQKLSDKINNNVEVGLYDFAQMPMPHGLMSTVWSFSGEYGFEKCVVFPRCL